LLFCKDLNDVKQARILVDLWSLEMVP